MENELCLGIKMILFQKFTGKFDHNIGSLVVPIVIYVIFVEEMKLMMIYPTW